MEEGSGEKLPLKRALHRPQQTLISFLEVSQVINIGACILTISLFGMVIN